MWGPVEVTKPYKFIGFGAMDVTKPYKFIGFGAIRDAKMENPTAGRSSSSGPLALDGTRVCWHPLRGLVTLGATGTRHWTHYGHSNSEITDFFIFGGPGGPGGPKSASRGPPRAPPAGPQREFLTEFGAPGRPRDRGRYSLLRNGASGP